ncbi:unknown [Bacillus sp. CAG:988]|nr:unknown [Bacillus sp. CAG:988]
MEVDLKDASQVTKSIEGRIEAIGSYENEQRQIKIDYNDELAKAYVQLVSDVANEIPQRNQVFAFQASSQVIGNFYRKEDCADKRSIAILNQHGLGIYLEFDKDRTLNQSELYAEEYLNRVLEKFHISVQILEGEDMGDRKIAVVTYCTPSEDIKRLLNRPTQIKL